MPEPGSVQVKIRPEFMNKRLKNRRFQASCLSYFITLKGVKKGFLPRS